MWWQGVAVVIMCAFGAVTCEKEETTVGVARGGGQ